MNRTVAWALVALVTLLTHLAKDRASAQSIEVRSYQILPGSMYTYKPSPWVGIPGGMPDPFRLEFGVDGAFDVEFDDTADTARLVNMQLALTGNEAVQMNPPLISPVTADRVEDRLEERVLHNQFVAGPYEQYKDSVWQFFLADFLNGAIELNGGYDATFVDGDGMLFDLSARQIPEPAAGTLIVMGALGWFRFARTPLRPGRGTT